MQVTLYINLSVSQFLLDKGVLNISLPLICCAYKGTEVCKELASVLVESYKPY